jgi:hypothetical protein
LSAFEVEPRQQEQLLELLLIQATDTGKRSPSDAEYLAWRGRIREARRRFWAGAAIELVKHIPERPNGIRFALRKADAS